MTGCGALPQCVVDNATERCKTLTTMSNVKENNVQLSPVVEDMSLYSNTKLENFVKREHFKDDSTSAIICSNAALENVVECLHHDISKKDPFNNVISRSKPAENKNRSKHTGENNKPSLNTFSVNSSQEPPPIPPRTFIRNLQK